MMNQKICILILTIFAFSLHGQVEKTSSSASVNEQPGMVSERIRLSYVDPARCSQLLNFYGVNIGDPKKPIDKNKLPIIVAIPQTTFHETVPDHEKVFPQTETDPINELLLFYDPTRPEEAGKIRRIITEQIDLPARKIMIEAMVLEIASQELDQLGVQWNYSGVASDNNFAVR